MIITKALSFLIGIGELDASFASHHTHTKCLWKLCKPSGGKRVLLFTTESQDGLSKEGVNFQALLNEEVEEYEPLGTKTFDTGASSISGAEAAMIKSPVSAFAAAALYMLQVL